MSRGHLASIPVSGADVDKGFDPISSRSRKAESKFGSLE